MSVYFHHSQAWAWRYFGDALALGQPKLKPENELVRMSVGDTIPYTKFSVSCCLVWR